MASSKQKDKLTALQRSVLHAFFAREKGFFLTGGAALAGFYLGHRETSDLDLFTLEDTAFERGRFVLRDVARTVNAEIEVSQDAPGFHRVVLTTASEGLVVDLVREQVFQLHADKQNIDGIFVDSADEILANKLTTLVGRAEERDLIDVLFLLKRGHRLEDAIGPALQKDGGCTPANLAWVLSQITIPDGVTLPAGVAPSELRDFVKELIGKLRRMAHPGEQAPVVF